MNNQPAINQMNIKVATLEAAVANWEERQLQALQDGNLVAGREARNEARLANDELFEAKRELRKLELSHVERPARSYTCMDYSDANGPVNTKITLSTGETFTVWHKSTTRSRALVELQDLPGGLINRSSARAMAEMLNGATLVGHEKIHYNGEKNGFTTTTVFPAA